MTPMSTYRIRITWNDNTATIEDGTYETRKAAEAVAETKAIAANTVLKNLGIEAPFKRIDIIEIGA